MNKLNASLFLAVLISFFCASAASAQDSRCISAYGKTACGYNCVSSYGEVKCSKTPSGACKAAYGKIVCYDPPKHSREKAECVSAYGDIVCGYNCVSAYGKIKCSNVPNGICKAAYGDIECFEPEVNRGHGGHGGGYGGHGGGFGGHGGGYGGGHNAPSGPAAECKSAYGKTVCGYNCVAAYGDVKCSQKPSGACKSAYGKIVCFDPSYSNKKAECIEGYGNIACGYGCASGYGKVKCSSSPNGICRAEYGDVKCYE